VSESLLLLLLLLLLFDDDDDDSSSTLSTEYSYISLSLLLLPPPLLLLLLLLLLTRLFLFELESDESESITICGLLVHAQSHCRHGSPSGLNVSLPKHSWLMQSTSTSSINLDDRQCCRWHVAAANVTSSAWHVLSALSAHRLLHTPLGRVVGGAVVGVGNEQSAVKKALSTVLCPMHAHELAGKPHVHDCPCAHGPPICCGHVCVVRFASKYTHVKTSFFRMHSPGATDCDSHAVAK
jgi:hypothetical protein